MLRLLFNADGLSVGIKLYDAVSLGILHVVGEYQSSIAYLPGTL